VGDVVIIAIDTQWWLHRHEKSIGEADGCNVLDAAGFMVDFREALKNSKFIQSMSRKGDCWDNACAESFFKTLKQRGRSIRNRLI